jgi:hypothetical protein
MPAHLSIEEMRAAAQVAARFWTDIAGSSATIQIADVTSENCLSNSSVLCWVTDVRAVCFGGAGPAITTDAAGCEAPWVSPTDGKTYPKIALNAHMSEQNATASLVCLLTHMMGHALGLDHRLPSSTPSIMRACYSQPQPDDISAVRFLYPEPVVTTNTAGDVHIPCVVHGQAAYWADLRLVRSANGAPSHFVVRDTQLRDPRLATTGCAQFIFEQNGDQLYNINVRGPDGKDYEYNTRLVLSQMILPIHNIVIK